MRDLRVVAWSMSQLPGEPSSFRGRGICVSCGGGTYKGSSICAKCSMLQSAQVARAQRVAQRVPVQPRPRVPCWICGKPMTDRPRAEGRQPTCNACTREHGAGICTKCGGPMRISSGRSTPPERRRCRACIPVLPKAAPGNCKLCEVPYVPRKGARPDQSFCSKSCKTAWQNGARPPYTRRADIGDAMMRKKARCRARLLRHAQTWDGITDEEILERDAWRCQIPDCKRRPIRRDASFPHPRSKSIDHIVPLSLGGDDTAANKRAAHLSCNVTRGNRMEFEQVALFGVIREAPLVTRTATGARVRPPRAPRLCGDCGEPLVAGKCGLHLPVYFGACDHCDGAFASRDRKRRHCRDEVCLKERTSQAQAQARERMSEDARERKRRRDRERRWIDPDYRARAIAATARWHDKNRVSQSDPDPTGFADDPSRWRSAGNCDDRMRHGG